MTKAVTLHLGSEFVPVMAFYIAGQFYNFTTSAIILAGTTAVATTISLAIERRVPIVSVSSSVFVCCAGALSYFLREPDILILADSLYYFFASFAVGFGLLRGAYLLKWVFGEAITMAAYGWRILSWRWVGASFLAGVGNESVRIFASPEFWIDYKLVKVVLVLAFVGWWIMLARRYTLVSPDTTTISTPEVQGKPSSSYT